MLNSEQIGLLQQQSNETIKKIIDGKVHELSYFGGAMNRRNKLYRNWLKEKKLKDSLANFDKFRSLANPTFIPKKLRPKRIVQKKKKPCDEYKTEYWRYICAHPEDKKLYLNKKYRNKCQDYVSNGIKRDKDFLANFLPKNIDFKKVQKAIEESKKMFDKKDKNDIDLLKLVSATEKKLEQLGVDHADLKLFEKRDKSGKNLLPAYLDYLASFFGDHKIPKDIIKSVKGGYFLPEDEQMINRRMVNDSISKIIKARGASYGGTLDVDDDDDFEEIYDGGCMDCPYGGAYIGGAMNRKAKVYKDWLKKKGLRDSIKAWDAFKKTALYKKSKIVKKGGNITKRVAKKKLSVAQQNWINKVKTHAAKHNISYGDALTDLGKKKKAQKKGKGY